jgi:hypothetical protein
MSKSKTFLAWLEIDSLNQQAIQACVTALNLHATIGESDAQASVAKNINTIVHSQIRPALQKHQSQAYAGFGFGNGKKNSIGYRPSWEHSLGVCLDCTARANDCEAASIDFLDLELCTAVLFECNRLSPKDCMQIIAKLASPIARNHLSLHVIEDVLAFAELVDPNVSLAQLQILAEPYILQLPTYKIFDEIDYRYEGYRTLMRISAQRGDSMYFFKLWPKCNARIEKQEIEDLKSSLVANMSRVHGETAALQLLDNTKIGMKYLNHIFTPLIDGGYYERLLKFLRDHTELTEQFAGGALELRVKAFCVSQQKKLSSPQTPSFLFRQLFDEVYALDPNFKQGAAKLRDALLYELGNASDDERYIKACAKAIKNNSIKRELNSKLQH